MLRGLQGWHLNLHTVIPVTSTGIQVSADNEAHGRSKP
jgi:hypothetical protein